MARKNIWYDIIGGCWKGTGTVEYILAANILILDKQKNSEKIINVIWKVVIGKNVFISADSVVRAPLCYG